MYKPKHFIWVLRQRTEENINALAGVTESQLVCQPWTWTHFKHGHRPEEGHDFDPRTKNLSERGLHVLPVSVWILSRCSGYDLEKTDGT